MVHFVPGHVGSDADPVPLAEIVRMCGNNEGDGVAHAPRAAEGARARPTPALLEEFPWLTEYVGTSERTLAPGAAAGSKGLAPLRAEDVEDAAELADDAVAEVWAKLDAKRREAELGAPNHNDNLYMAVRGGV